MIFGEFKLGEKRYAYPLARGVFEALRRRHLLEFDAIIPIPLSPDKETAGELHRTKILAEELGALLGTPVREYLTLAEPVSKRRMLGCGYTMSQFRQRYFSGLRVSEKITALARVLLIDDVMTRGDTAWSAIRRIIRENPHLEVVVATAGQMIVKAAVLSEIGFVK